MTKLILNNCIDCGRVPEMKILYGGNHGAECKCGKYVFSDFKNWSREVAADMWNRANPVESALDVKGVYLNFLAGELARYRLRVIVIENGLTIHETCPTDEETGDEIERLMSQCRLHTKELTAFYRKRLEPVHA